MRVAPAGNPGSHKNRELRCCCNRLLARVEGRTVVLKCPRCKRQAVLSLRSEAPGGEIELMFSDSI